MSGWYGCYCSGWASVCVGSATEWLSLCIDRSGFHTPDSPSPLRNRQQEPPGTLRTANVHNVSVQ